MELHGRHLIGAATSREGGQTFRAIDPRDGRVLDPDFAEASDAEIDRALARAADAHRQAPHPPRDARAALLDRVGDEIEALGDPLLERAEAETALPRPRLLGERGRTVGQFRMFADLVREGSWVDARIDRAQPDQRPPRPDVRQMLVPIGPVVVFGASNFPLAFSVGGGDTASALAAGCPVVVKAHPNHPGTSEMVGRAIRAAVEASALPEGSFSMLHGVGPRVGLGLVRHPCTKAVAFTGSLRGGRALFDAATSRPEPIPLYAEMGSINPVFLMPGALRERATEIAEGVFKALVMGVGQFCTNPGLIVAAEGEATRRFRDRLGELVTGARAGVMLHAGIRRGFDAGLARVRGIPGVAEVAHAAASRDSEPAEGCVAAPALFATDAQTFLSTSALSEEVFGPATLLVTCPSPDAFLEVVRAIGGQLTATIHAADDDLEAERGLVTALEEKAGRLVFNGYPTGVEVCPAMHHGGPYPATTDARTTSVGTAAIGRFTRPVCYQDLPSALHPEALRDDNPAGLLRLVDGVRTRD